MPLLIDRFLPWEGGFPYRVLEPFGLHPNSTSKAVLDASYDMTPEDLANTSVNASWEALRLARERLLVDFFCYDLPAPAAREPQTTTELPVPLALLERLTAEWPEGPRIPPPRVTLPPVLATPGAEER